MFIAHLPAGYLLAQSNDVLRQQQRWLISGTMLPDLDLVWFYVWDSGLVHHHSYLTHRPALWAAVLCMGLLFFQKSPGRPLAALGLGGLLHVALDSVAGAIAWGWPLSSHAAPLVEVPPTQDWWVMSFVLHWSFAIEIAICMAALAVFMHARATNR